MNEFISRRLLSLPAASTTIEVCMPGLSAVNVCSVLMCGDVFTRVWNSHSTIHYEGDVPLHIAAERFHEGIG